MEAFIFTDAILKVMTNLHPFQELISTANAK
jgi:hypothetical protein